MYEDDPDLRGSAADGIEEAAMDALVFIAGADAASVRG